MTKVKIITNTSNEVEVTLPQFRKVSHKFSGETFYAYFSENASENIQISFDSEKRMQSILNYATLDDILKKEESTEEEFIEAYANAEKHVNETLNWFLEPKIEKVPDSVIDGLEKWNNDKKDPCATEED